LLTGPNAVSAGDMLPVYFKNHPTLKIFGKPTAGAFGGFHAIDIGHPEEYYAAMQTGNMYLVADSSNYLSHSTLKIDFPVWLTPEGAANNRDDVIDAAVKWINENTVVENDNKVGGIIISPNPASDFIEVSLERCPTSKEINICNMLGEIVLTVGAENVLPTRVNVSTLPQGIYYLTIKTQDNTYETKKFEIFK